MASNQNIPVLNELLNPRPTHISQDGGQILVQSLTDMFIIWHESCLHDEINDNGPTRWVQSQMSPKITRIS